MLEPTALSVSWRLLSVGVHHNHAKSAIFITLTPCTGMRGARKTLAAWLLAAAATK